MKVNELMIGDWCRVNGIAVKVGAVHHDNIGIFDNDNSLYWCSDDGLDRIDPIPLTEEILVKNGFEFQRHEFKYTNDDYWISDDKRIIFRGKHMTNSFNKWSVHVDTEDMRAMAYLEFTYVHQLQHLLRLVGVQKEIEL